MRFHHLLALVCGLCVALLLGGCGGGGGTNSTTATVIVDWAGRAVSAPETVASVKVELTDNGSYTIGQTVNRPAADSSTVTFPNVPLKRLTLTVTAYAENNGQGAVLATGSSEGIIATKQPLRLDVSTAATIDQVIVTAPKTSISYGDTVQLTAQAVNANYDIVLVDTGSITWSTSDANIASVDPATGLVTATSSLGGQAVITATEQDSRVSGALTVSVLAGPPAPLAANYPVKTANYHTLYNTAAHTDEPFPVYWQFDSEHFPVPVSYERVTQEPAGFNLKQASERAFLEFAEADPRIAMISGVTPSQARIQVILEETVSYGGIDNIIGLTTVLDTNVPSFTVEVATSYRSNGTLYRMPVSEIVKILFHELGHALGLGHAPDERDLMYYMSNNSQGSTFDSYLTHGDAMALWSALTERAILWYPDRPTITPAPTGIVSRAPGTQVERGRVVDIYTRE